MWNALILALLLITSPAHAQALGLSPAGSTVASAYTANAVDFDASNDFMTRGSDLTGSADNNDGIISFWVRHDGSDGSNIVWIDTDGPRKRLFRATDNDLNISIRRFNGLTFFSDSTGEAMAASGTWHHLLFGWQSDGAGDCQLYINGVDTAITTCTGGSATHNQATDWQIGALNTATLLLDGCMADIYYNDSETLNFDTESNRLLFRDSSGKPVDLGSDGSTPTGNQPILFLNGDSTNFQTNAGDGGNFSVTGSLTACSTSPSD